jgi:hypothetical protein
MTGFKFPSIRGYCSDHSIVDENLFIYEKVDGSNVSLRNGHNGVELWSRGGPIRKNNRYYFDEFRKFVYQNLHSKLIDLPKELVIFGEFVHPGYGHIPYDEKYTNKMQTITIYNEESGLFLHPNEANEWLDLLGASKIIPYVPLKSKGKVNCEILESVIQKSSLYDGPPEGLIIHRYSDDYKNGLHLMKCYHPEFQEINPRFEGIDKYLTWKRFVKAGQKLLESGTLPDFEGLVYLTAIDVSDEMNVNSKQSISQDEVMEKIREDYIDKVNLALKSFKK